MKHLGKHQLVVVIILTFTMNGCVSVSIGNKNMRKSSSVEFVAPKKPFEKIDLKSADQAWQNRQTGTTLSYLSVCNDASDPSLDALRSSTLQGLEELSIKSENKFQYNSREAIKSEVSGKLDGVEVVVKMVIFKKNYCNYTISMVGLKGKSESDFVVFDDFTTGFRAP